MDEFRAVRDNTALIMRELARRLPARFSMPSRPFIIAIDGRCASGKSTLAAALREAVLMKYGSCELIHIDDFFLRPEQRTPERFLESGGNVDRERFLEEVLLPLETGKEFEFRPFDCRSMALSGPVRVEKAAAAIIEGSYCCHPALQEHYDLRIFLSIPAAEQKRRLLLREGEAGLRRFVERWIPLEEAYFSELKPEECCELRLSGM